MLSANEIYKTAYDIHYKKKNYSIAYAMYQKIVENYPNSDEAKYSATQINNIESSININVNNSESVIQTAQKIINGEKIEVETENMTEGEAEVYQRKKRVHSILLTTGYDFQGFKIIEYHDVIFDELIAGTGIITSIKSIGNALSNITGEELTAMSDRLNELKTILKERVILKAVDMGANALLGIDFESSIIISGTLMVSMTATAVTIEKIDSNSD